MTNYTHFLQQIKSASAEGFVHHFQLFPCGLIRCIDSNKEYSLEEILITVKCFPDFRTTFYYIITNDGLMGTAYEQWDV